MADECIDEVRREYVNLVDFLATTVRPLLLMPLAELAQVNEEMQTLAPILQPTAYHHGGGQNLHDQRRVIDAALALRRVLDALAPKGTDL